MKNNLEIFSSNEFGELRTINENGKVMFIASDVAKMLGYTNTSKAISDHCRYVTKRYIPHPQGKGTLEVNFIPEGDVYRLITHSKLPAAEKFESWVFDEVLPSIRKTGSYTAKPLDESKTKRLAIMERNAKVREAALWAKLADGSSGTYQQVCKAYAANTLAEAVHISRFARPMLPIHLLKRMLFPCQRLRKRPTPLPRLAICLMCRLTESADLPICTS